MPKSGVILSIKLEGDTETNRGFAKMAENLNQVVINVDKMASKMNAALGKMGEHQATVEKTTGGLNKMAISMASYAASGALLATVVGYFKKMDESAASIVDSLKDEIEQRKALAVIQDTAGQIQPVEQRSANIAARYGMKAGPAAQMFQAYQSQYGMDPKQAAEALKISAQLVQVGAEPRDVQQLMGVGISKQFTPSQWGNMAQTAANISMYDINTMASEIPTGVTLARDPYLGVATVAGMGNIETVVDPKQLGVYARQGFSALNSGMSSRAVNKYLKGKGWSNAEDMSEVDKLQALNAEAHRAGVDITKQADIQKWLGGFIDEEADAQFTIGKKGGGSVEHRASIALANMIKGMNPIASMGGQTLLDIRQKIIDAAQTPTSIPEEKIAIMRKGDPSLAGKMDIDIAAATRIAKQLESPEVPQMQQAVARTYRTGQDIENVVGPRDAASLGMVDPISKKATWFGNLVAGMSRGAESRDQLLKGDMSVFGRKDVSVMEIAGARFAESASLIPALGAGIIWAIKEGFNSMSAYSPAKKQELMTYDPNTQADTR